MDFVSSNHRGLLYGDGVFETMRVDKKGVWELALHIARLRKTIAFFGFKVDLDSIIQKMTELAFDEPGLVRLTIVRSSSTGPFSGQDGGVYWSSRPLTTINPPSLVGILGLFQPGYVLHEFKTTSYLRSVYCRMQAEGLGYGEGLMLSREGEVGETSTANIWVVFDDRVVTPPASGLLAGITRESILRRKLGSLPILVRPLQVEELFNAKEIALSSVGVGLLAVRSFSFQDRCTQLGSSWTHSLSGELFA